MTLQAMPSAAPEAADQPLGYLVGFFAMVLGIGWEPQLETN